MSEINIAVVGPAGLTGAGHVSDKAGNNLFESISNRLAGANRTQARFESTSVVILRIFEARFR